jgi:hypothetical protein
MLSPSKHERRTIFPLPLRQAQGRLRQTPLIPFGRLRTSGVLLAVHAELLLAIHAELLLAVRGEFCRPFVVSLSNHASL